MYRGVCVARGQAEGRHTINYGARSETGDSPPVTLNMDLPGGGGKTVGVDDG